MGGYGSTRWDWHTKKDTVEDCRTLEASRWMREGILRLGIRTWGSWAWWDAANGEKTSSIGYEVNTIDPSCLWVRLHYTFTRTGENCDYRIGLTTTRPNFGGLRWWFVCQLVVNARACNRRVGKIYLPPTGRYYGCRHCYDLTYKSCQESDKRVSWLRRNPEAIRALMDDINSEVVDTSRLILAMKAMRW